MVPLPLTDTAVGELLALLIKDTVPVTFAADDGLKVMETARLSAGAMLAGSARADTPKLGSLIFTAVMVAVLPPEFVSTTVRDAVVPTRTEPKSAEVGATARLAGVAGGGGVDVEAASPVVPQPERTAAKIATAAVAPIRTSLRLAI